LQSRLKAELNFLTVNLRQQAIQKIIPKDFQLLPGNIRGAAGAAE
jgi:hypothetical protein